MHSTTIKTERKSLNANLKETWEIGKQLYWQGVHAYSAVHKAIRYLGFYLYMGDEERGIPSMKDDDRGRAKLILDLVTRKLFWSVEKAKELWNDIYNACIWRKNKPQQKSEPMPSINSTNSSNSSNSINRINSSTITICDSDASNQEYEYPSKEEGIAIVRNMLKGQFDFDKPKGMYSLMQRAIGI